MSSQQATFDEFEQAQPVARETLFERLTGQRETVERQQPDGDRVSEREPLDLEDGLTDAIGSTEVLPER